MTLEIRSIDIREVDTDKRTLKGLAAVWADIADVQGYKEQFERGAFAGAEGVKLFYGHSEPIGKVTRGTDTDEGYEIEAVISRTARGDEVYELLKDGVLDKFSVGFIPVEQRQDDDIVIRTKVDLKEVSIVPFPAYKGAKISEVRSENTNNEKETNDSNALVQVMDNENTITELRSEMERLERDLTVKIENSGTTEVQVPNFRSAGEFIKALADGDEKAKTEIRAYTGAVLTDSHTSNDWKADLLKVVDKGRPLVNLFNKGPLGAQGNNVEFPFINAVTGDVDVQAAEGDDLDYIEVDVNTATAPVKTYGGYSEVSRQVIERSDVSYLDAVLRAQAASYAKVTNAAVRAAIVAATPQTGSAFTMAAATGASFIGAAIDGVQKIDDNGSGLNADFILVSTDVYVKLAGLIDGANRPLFDINGDGSNTFGNINVRGIAGSLAGLPVVVDAGLGVRSLYVASQDAVQTWENAGAPLRLQDENIINLTKQFSLYGYMAVGVKNANGLVKAAITAS